MRHKDYTISQVSGTAYAVALAGLQVLCLPDDTPLPTDAGEWWLVTASGLPVAFAALSESPLTIRSGFLSRAGVLPAHRGNGLQAALIKAREKRARQLGYLALVTNTYDNPQSGNNLIRAGFSLFTPEDPWGCDGTNYWRKVLT